MKKILIIIMLSPFYLAGQIVVDKLYCNKTGDVSFMIYNTDTVDYFVSLELEIKKDSIWCLVDNDILVPSVSKMECWIKLQSKLSEIIQFNINNILKSASLSAPTTEIHLAGYQKDNEFRIKVNYVPSLDEKTEYIYCYFTASRIFR